MYNYKVYDKTGTYKFTINPSIVKNRVSFSANINGGQWQFTLVLNGVVDIDSSDILKVYRKTKLVYTGVFQNVEKSISQNGIEYSYPVLWIFSVMSMIRYQWPASYTQDPAITCKDIIDDINAIFNFLSYSGTSIPNFWSTRTLNFSSKQTFFEALKSCVDLMGRYIYIDQNWLVTIKEKWTVKDYSLTIGKEISQIEITEDAEKIANRVLVRYDVWTYTVTDAISIATYWQKDFRFENTDFSLAEATTYGDNYLANNKEPKIQTQADVVRTDFFDFDDVKIGDIVKINNTKDVLSVLQIVKYSYNEEKMSLYFEDFSSFWKEISLLTS